MNTETKKEWIKLNLQEEKESQQEKWAKYYNDTYSDVIKIDKYYLPIRKSSIKKDFCFGYGLNGVSTEEDYEAAANMRDHASKSEKYFLNENLQEITEEISILELYLKNFGDNFKFHSELRANNLDRYNYEGKIFLYSSYRNRPYQIEYTFYDDLRECHPYKNFILREATKNEIELILEGLKEEKARFEKRLNSYLKRYGTSKIRSWTYLVD